MRASPPFTVSVVIPTYNRRFSLGECLESVFSQSHPVNEIIVVDDGSTDGTSEWVRKSFPHVKLISQSNKGVSAARNAGIRHSSSEWVAFLDSDDCWLPKKIEKQVAALKAHSQYRICHTEEAWIFRGKAKKIPPHLTKQHGAIFEHCLRHCAISPSTVVIHKTIFDEVGYFDEKLPVCEDYDLWLRISSKHDALLVDEPLIEKRGGNEDQLSLKKHLDVFRIQALVNLLHSKQLNTEYTRLTREILIEKCDIVAGGITKKGIRSEAIQYLTLAQKLRTELELSDQKTRLPLCGSNKRSLIVP